MILPHQLFAALFEYDRGIFIDKLCGGSEDRIARFWNEMAGHPAYGQGHPLHLRPDHRTKCIPLSLHGDGVTAIGLAKSWGKTVDAMSWASVLSKGSTISTQFMIYIIYWSSIVFEAVSYTHLTLPTILRV